MELLAKILRKLGFTGKTLDKAITQMSKLDAYLEEVETLEKAAAAKADAAAVKSIEASRAATTNAERAARIRSRAQDFVA